MATAPPGYLTINEAAAELDASPWRVMELVSDGELESVTFVKARLA